MKDANNHNAPELAEAIDRAARTNARSLVEVDVERYQAILDDEALSHAQKAQIIDALWAMITAFVELGFGVHPAQQACGKPGTELEQTGVSESTGVRSNHRKHEEIDTPSP